jgi:hypothetical protein
VAQHCKEQKLPTMWATMWGTTLLVVSSQSQAYYMLPTALSMHLHTSRVNTDSSGACLEPHLLLPMLSLSRVRKGRSTHLYKKRWAERPTRRDVDTCAPLPRMPYILLCSPPSKQSTRCPKGSRFFTPRTLLLAPAPSMWQ